MLRQEKTGHLQPRNAFFCCDELALSLVMKVEFGNLIGEGTGLFGKLAAQASSITLGEDPVSHMQVCPHCGRLLFRPVVAR